jgi:hypothetical protein
MNFYGLKMTNKQRDQLLIGWTTMIFGLGGFLGVKLGERLYRPISPAQAVSYDEETEMYTMRTDCLWNREFKMTKEEFQQHFSDNRLSMNAKSKLYALKQDWNNVRFMPTLSPTLAMACIDQDIRVLEWITEKRLNDQKSRGTTEWDRVIARAKEIYGEENVCNLLKDKCGVESV